MSGLLKALLHPDTQLHGEDNENSGVLSRMIKPICFTASDEGRCMFQCVDITERCVTSVTVQLCDTLQCAMGPLITRTSLVEKFRTICSG